MKLMKFGLKTRMITIFNWFNVIPLKYYYLKSKKLELI